MPILTYLKLGGIAVGAMLLLGGFLYVQHLRSEAAKVPALQATIADGSKRALALSDRITAVEAAREESDKALSQWQDLKNATLEAVRKEGRRAAASTNPVCAPSLDDRRLRNSALGALLGPDPSGAKAGVSTSPNPAH